MNDDITLSMYHHVANIGPRWTQRFLDLAEVVAQWSKDPSLKCGAVVVNDKHRVVGLGYNGFPDRIADKPEWLEDRDEKYPMIIHAEVNAILNATASVEGCSLFVTSMPCHDCAKFIVQAGIAEVHYHDHQTGPQAEYLTRWADRVAIAKKVFDRAGVPMIPAPIATPAEIVGETAPILADAVCAIEPFNTDECDAGRETTTVNYLRELATTLMNVPVMHGTDQRDVDRLNELASHIEKYV